MAVLYYFFRYLTEKVVPGNRVTVMGIYSIKKSGKLNKKVSKLNVKHTYFSCNLQHNSTVERCEICKYESLYDFPNEFFSNESNSLH